MRRAWVLLALAAFSVSLVTAPVSGGEDPPASPLGTNLAHVTDFTAEYPFVNHFKQAREWISGNGRTGAFDDGRALELDGKGYVTKLKRDQVARTVMFTGTPVDPALVERHFILTHTGKGSFSYGGSVSVVEDGPNRDVIALETPAPDGEQTVIITLTRTSPRNPVRNIKLVPTGGICTSDPFDRSDGPEDCPSDDFVSFETATDEIRFNPVFLDRIRGYSSIRFMDWMRTNDSPIKMFSQRAKVKDAFWSTEAGVPLEIMIELANLLGVDPWFNIPHRADDDFVRGFAKIVRDRLEIDLRPYFEYSNEVW
ncbi:MAG: hypothetical protein WD826_11255, partial [Actinomycetota bacterium]